MPESYAGTQDQQMARGEKRKFDILQSDVRFKGLGYLQLTKSFSCSPGREIIVGGVADLMVRWSYGPDGV